MESDDNLNAFLKKPIRSPAKVVAKRHQNDFARTPLSDFPIRQKSMPVHSSVLAMSNKSLSSVHPMSNGIAKNAEKNHSHSTPMVVKSKNVPKSLGNSNQ